ncbi:ABC transporter permease [Nonomuraea sp. 10N515B]|uniref:ABC transporter permease n=1 Tax=Nonomuraea sp. 10N515B TaxID=3457422 RepID=UPI003FCD0AA0
MNALTGTGRLFLLYLRRDRLVATCWVVFLPLLVVSQVASYETMLPTETDRVNFVAQVGGNAALTAFSGRLYGDALGNLAMWKIGDIAYTLVAFMAVLSVIRHTRAEEESGRAELVGSTVVGRFASLTASLLLAWAVSLAAGLLTALGMIGYGLDTPGSFTVALGMTGPGLVLAAVAGLAAQLTERARTAGAIAFTVLGLQYLIRFTADGGGILWLRWLSPNGWSHLMRPFGGDLWWVFLLPVAACLAISAAAYRLAARRDLGAGVLQSRPGPAVAAPGLRSSPAMAWRLERGQLLGWTGAYAGFSAITAGVANGIPEIAEQAGPQIEEFFRRYTASPDADLSDTFIWMVLLSLAGIATLYPMLSAVRLRAEETSGRAELLLSTPVGRVRWAGGHLLFAALGSLTTMTASGLAAGLVYGLTTGDVGAHLPRVLGAALSLVPAVWAVGAVGILALGLIPRWAVATVWVVFMFQQLFGEQIGPALGIDYWIANAVVPMHHIPKVLTGAEFDATPLLVLTVLAVALGGVGLTALKRRDLT